MIMLNTFKSPADIEAVRELGREFQELVSIANFSYGELVQMQTDLAEIAAHYGLTQEFQENGII